MCYASIHLFCKFKIPMLVFVCCLKTLRQSTWDTVNDHPIDIYMHCVSICLVGALSLKSLANEWDTHTRKRNQSISPYGLNGAKEKQRICYHFRWPGCKTKEPTHLADELNCLISLWKRRRRANARPAQPNGHTIVDRAHSMPRTELLWDVVDWAPPNENSFIKNAPNINRQWHSSVQSNFSFAMNAPQQKRHPDAAMRAVFIDTKKSHFV